MCDVELIKEPGKSGGNYGIGVAADFYGALLSNLLSWLLVLACYV